VKVNGRSLGHKKVNLLNPRTAFRLSSVHRNVRAYEGHLKRFLAHADLDAIQWINLNRQAIEFKTLLK